MKIHVLFYASILFAGSVHAQQAVQTISKDEFVKSQLAMMEQMKQTQKDIAADSDKMMQEKMSAQDYAEYKQEAEASQKQQEQKVADCLGIPTEEIARMTDKVGPDFQIGVIKNCASELPDTLSLENLDWNSNVDFAAYKKCAEDMVATEIGVSSETLQRCSAMAENL